MAGSSGTSYRGDIDGLRAISVLLVVVFHYFPELISGGYIGVDVFFVISGFLITKVIMNGIDEKRFSFFEFYARRARRIFPGLLTVLVSCLVFGAMVLRPDEYETLGRYTAAAAFSVINFALYKDVGYFAQPADTKPLLHLWSLSVEEQFYLFFPILLVALRKVGLSYRPIFIAMLGLSLVCCLIWTDEDPSGAFYFPLSRAWELLAGAVVATRDLRMSERVSSFGTLAGVGLILAGGVFLNDRFAYPSGWATIPVAGALLIISTGHCRSKALLLDNAPMRHIGKLSYVLYLWHWPALSFATILTIGTPTKTEKLALLCLSIGLTVLTHFTVEKPLRVGGLKRAATVSALTACLGAGGWFVFWSQGLPQRIAFPDALPTAFLWDQQKLSVQTACMNRHENIAHPMFCLETPGHEPVIALLGDSHANALFYGVAHHYERLGKGVVNFSLPGCPMLYGISARQADGIDTCERAGRILDYVKASTTITDVILHTRGPFYTSGRGFGEAESRAWVNLVDTKEGVADNQKVYLAALDRTLESLIEASKRITIILDVPELGFDPRKCFQSRPLSILAVSTQRCSVPIEEFQSRNADYLRDLMYILARFPSIEVKDPASLFCDRRSCRVNVENKILYRDSGHLSYEGSIWVGEKLFGYGQ